MISSEISRADFIALRPPDDMKQLDHQVPTALRVEIVHSPLCMLPVVPVITVEDVVDYNRSLAVFPLYRSLPRSMDIVQGLERNMLDRGWKVVAIENDGPGFIRVFGKEASS